MTLDKTAVRRPKSSRKIRRAVHLDAPTPSVISAAQPPHHTREAQHILQLQSVIGNHATRQHLTTSDGVLQRELVGMPTIHPTTPHIQRDPLSDKEAELAAAELARESTKSGTKARTRINQKIAKLKEEIEALKSAPKPEPEPPKPKTAAEEFPTLKPTFTDEEITNLRDTLSADKLKELVALFQPAQLKGAVTTLTLSKFKELADAFPAQQLFDLGGLFGGTKLKNILVKFTVSDFKTNITTLTGAKFNELVTALTIDQVWDLGAQLTLEKLKQLITAWPVSEFKLVYGSLGLDILKDLMSQFTGAELKTFVTTVGVVRFQDLVKVKKLKATGLKKYGADWLKTFVGANATTMHHLTTIYTKSDGVISGGHDAAIFYPELDRIIGTAIFEDDEGEEYEDDVTNGRVTSKQVKSNYDKVIYATHNPDGSTKNTGAKSLIHNLMSQQAQWLKRANEAIWGAIRDETFDKSGGAWSGTSEDGVDLNGFYQSGKVQVDTFFPVN